MVVTLKESVMPIKMSEPPNVPRFLLNQIAIMNVKISKFAVSYNSLMPKSPYPLSTYTQNAKIYKILANAIRLQILNTIKKESASVEELTQITGLKKPNVSQHLSILRRYDLVVTVKKGRTVYYQIRDPRIIDPCKTLHEYYQNLTSI